MKILLMLAICAVGVFAQDAKIIVLEPSETEAAKTAYQAIIDAQNKYDELQANLIKKYELQADSVLNFSKDFKAAEPSAEIAQARRILGCWSQPAPPQDVAGIYNWSSKTWLTVSH